MNEKKDNNKDKKFDSKKTKSLLILVVISLAITIMLNGVMTRIKEGNQEKISYGEFLSLLDAGEVEEVSVESDRVILTPKNQKNPVIKTTYFAIRMADGELVNRLEEAKKAGRLEKYEAPEESGSSMLAMFFVNYILPFVLIYGAFYVFMRIGGKGGMMGSVGKAQPRYIWKRKQGLPLKMWPARMKQKNP